MPQIKAIFQMPTSIYTNPGGSTVTDSLGGFKLSYPGQGLAYIVISHIGYQNDTIFASQVKPGQKIEVNLISRTTLLNEVVVHDVYDPALILMRKVMASGTIFAKMLGVGMTK